MDQLKDVDRRVLFAGVGGVIAGSFLAGNAKAGTLEPPAGQVAPTGRRLSDIGDRIARTTVGCSEPRIPIASLSGSTAAQYVISSSGSYYLTDNLYGSPGLDGIHIAADNVDLDLGGFHLYGAPQDPTGLSSSSAIVSSAQNVTVYDGTLIGWSRGVDFGQASLFIIWDVASIGASSGAFFLGDRGQAYDCDAYSCAGAGFSAMGVRTLVEECGAWTCGVGFIGINSPNLFLSNCATECSAAFELPSTSSYGPIVSVAGAGDISSVQGSSHPSANLVY